VDDTSLPKPVALLKPVMHCIFLSTFVGGCIDQVAVLSRKDVLPFRQCNVSLTNRFNQQLTVNYNREIDIESVNTRQTLAGSDGMTPITTCCRILSLDDICRCRHTFKVTKCTGH